MTSSFNSIPGANLAAASLSCGSDTQLAAVISKGIFVARWQHYSLLIVHKVAVLSVVTVFKKIAFCTLLTMTGITSWNLRMFCAICRCIWIHISTCARNVIFLDNTK